MMKPTDEELDILKNQRFLTLKHSISEKVVTYLSEIERALHQEVHQSNFDFPKGTFLKAGKISKGENYRLLPYYILDYPRLFSKQEVFAFRTMLWWGNHFSCTLHLSGPVLERSKDRLCCNLIRESGLYFCINEQPWEYHFDEENYVQIRHLDELKIVKQIEENGFVKISNFIPIEDWTNFKKFTLDSFARFLRTL